MLTSGQAMHSYHAFEFPRLKAGCGSRKLSGSEVSQRVQLNHQWKGTDFEEEASD
jgi:hypothetical protein